MFLTILVSQYVEVTSECCLDCIWNFYPARHAWIDNPCKKLHRIGRYCGGKGYCNIFCCNCDNGCKNLDEAESHTQNRARRNPNNSYPSKILDFCDSNKDRTIDFKEAISCLNFSESETNKLRRNISWFEQMDFDSDGFIQPGELDESIE
uniref:EF-hand domain-containing protein n=1 Tax=Acrobeloides nanus TaxID=290746 RepID=A0A914DQJ1_9BILA